MSALKIAISVLNAASGVTAIVGSGTASRIFGDHAPQNTAKPYIVASIVAETDSDMLGGQARYPNSRISVSCFGATALAAHDLAEAVISAMNVTNHTVSSFTANIGRADSDVSFYDGDLECFLRVVDFYVRWR